MHRSKPKSALLPLPELSDAAPRAFRPALRKKGPRRTSAACGLLDAWWRTAPPRNRHAKKKKGKKKAKNVSGALRRIAFFRSAPRKEKAPQRSVLVPGVLLLLLLPLLFLFALLLRRLRRLRRPRRGLGDGERNGLLSKEPVHSCPRLLSCIDDVILLAQAFVQDFEPTIQKVGAAHAARHLQKENER